MNGAMISEIKLEKNSNVNGTKATDKSGELYIVNMSQNDVDSQLPDNRRQNEENCTMPSERKFDNSKNVKTPVKDMDPDTVCGIACFKPQWIQAWATSKTYLVFFSIVGVIQGSYYTYFVGTMTTLEKRYAFKSKISGSVLMLDEITPLALGVFIGYFGGKSHRPRMLAVGMFLSTISCFVAAFPYFLYGTAQHLLPSAAQNGTGPDFCTVDKVEQCNQDDRPATMTAVGCLFIATFLKGFGNVSFHVIGLSYMDDTAKKKNTPIYFATSTCLRLLGPVIGFLMSSTFLKYYEDPTFDPGFGPEDSRWVGAWWMGFVLQGIFLLIFTTPLLLFPRRLPKQRQRIASDEQDISHETLCDAIKGLLSGMKKMAKNALFMLFTIGFISSAIGGFGFFIMLPKYMENQFRLTASEASLLSGPPGIVAIQISTFIGGFLMWKWHPTAKQLIAGNVIAEGFGALAYSALMIPSCREYILPGSSSIDGVLELQNECNAACNCTTNVLSPLCGSDGISTYFSPCYAGCTSSITKDGVEYFQNCSCLHDDEGNFHSLQSVESGFCLDENCHSQLVLFIAGLLVLCAVNNVMRVAHQILLLRSIEPKDKGMALGMFEMMCSALAFLPYPIIYGALVDGTCLVWEKSCDETGNCWLYDLKRFKRLIHGAPAVFSTVAAICYGITYFLADRVNNIYDEEFPEKKTEKPKASEITNTTTL